MPTWLCESALELMTRQLAPALEIPGQQWWWSNLGKSSESSPCYLSSSFSTLVSFLSTCGGGPLVSGAHDVQLQHLRWASGAVSENRPRDIYIYIYI